MVRQIQPADCRLNPFPGFGMDQGFMGLKALAIFELSNWRCRRGVLQRLHHAWFGKPRTWADDFCNRRSGMTLTNCQAVVTHSRRRCCLALAIFAVTKLRGVMHNPDGSSAKHLAGIAQIRLVLADVLGGTQKSSQLHFG